MPDLHGYGPHTLGASNFYDVKCVNGHNKRNIQLTIGINRRAGDVTIQSRRRGSLADYEVQSYKKADETLAAAAIATDATIRVDATNKDIRLVTGVGADLDVDFSIDNEA